MLPVINNKSLLDCDLNDFKIILHNSDYRENQYIDYKKDFSFRKTIDKKTQENEIIEFRNDICSFANSYGGYLIYGIKEVEGVPTELIGVDIDDIDKFELELRNKLSIINPKTPSISIKFVEIATGKYLVIIYVDHDDMGPYVHIENQKNYKIYKREGNQKTTMSYMDIRNMFISTSLLEDKIMEFRNKRFFYYMGDYGPAIGRFMIFHFIPQSFLNSKKQLFILEKNKQKNFDCIFSGTRIDSNSIPCVDGLRFISTYDDRNGIIYNNGIVELLLPLKSLIYYVHDKEYFPYNEVWKCIESIVRNYKNELIDVFGKQIYYGCTSIYGCKDILSESDDLSLYKSCIDRDIMFCEPVAFMDISNNDEFNKNLNMLKLEYLLSLGIKKKKVIAELVSELK